MAQQSEVDTFGLAEMASFDTDGKSDEWKDSVSGEDEANI